MKNKSRHLFKYLFCCLFVLFTVALVVACRAFREESRIVITEIERQKGQPLFVTVDVSNHEGRLCIIDGLKVAWYGVYYKKDKRWYFWRLGADVGSLAKSIQYYKELENGEVVSKKIEVPMECLKWPWFILSGLYYEEGNCRILVSDIHTPITDDGGQIRFKVTKNKLFKDGSNKIPYELW